MRPSDTRCKGSIQLSTLLQAAVTSFEWFRALSRAPLYGRLSPPRHPKRAHPLRVRERHVSVHDQGAVAPPDGNERWKLLETVRIVLQPCFFICCCRFDTG
eukprot:12099345-Alexandrium_andersonii.AAC.1